MMYEQLVAQRIREKIMWIDNQAEKSPEDRLRLAQLRYELGKAMSVPKKVEGGG